MKSGTSKALAGAVGRRVVLAVAIAVSVVVVGGWTGRSARPSEVTVLREKVVTVNATATAIGFEGKRVAGPRLRIADVDGVIFHFLVRRPRVVDHYHAWAVAPPPCPNSTRRQRSRYLAIHGVIKRAGRE